MTQATTPSVDRIHVQAGIDVSTTVDLLRRYAFVERSCLHALSGWFLVVPAYETKYVLGYQLWGHAERVDVIRQRLQELRGGHRDANIEPALAHVGTELLHAPDAGCFLAGLNWMLGQLAAAYREHLRIADPAANAMELRLVRRLLADVEDAQAALGRATQPQPPDPGVQAWTDYLDSLLNAAGGVTGLAPRQNQAHSAPVSVRFMRPQRIIFDARIQTGALPSQEQKLALPFAERRVEEFKTFFNEFYAAALLASMIFDAWQTDAPWEFYFDLSHHFWDEVRHSEFGWRRLRELGVEPSIVNQVLFEQAQGMPFLHRLCYLTLGLEVFFMPRKKPRVRQYADAGDSRSQLFADVDWSDEQNHVRYGKRWVDYFLEDDARTVEHLQSEISDYLAAYQSQLPAGQLAPF